MRLRQAGGGHTITFKGPPTTGAYKSREEIESGVCDAASMRLILEGLEYISVFRYEKYRTEYAKPRENGLVMLDQPPIGDFLELERPPRWIDRTARALGRSPANYHGELMDRYTCSRGRADQDRCEPVVSWPAEESRQPS